MIFSFYGSKIILIYFDILSVNVIFDSDQSRCLFHNR